MVVAAHFLRPQPGNPQDEDYDTYAVPMALVGNVIAIPRSI